VGAYAVVYYTEPRFTKDIDIWVNQDIKNAHKLCKALKEFGAPLKDISVTDFTNKKMIYQIGVAPIRIDIILGLYNLKFNSAWKNRTRTKYGGVPINVLGINELIKSKKKSKRAQDRLDLKKLKTRFKNKRSGNKKN